ncbi:hypothetical protein NLJ89_g1617 [Agrocybe chaxingu]|uniref:Protein kinase domain-containing protein n=1 Tax=Agrocybe chaxingu TaxID=84603 RepID=A0A9W8MZP0_9AGAR|nr:hypothetical protein NLJ89_g1617 [Agrocybe chaxingu]
MASSSGRALLTIETLESLGLPTTLKGVVDDVTSYNIQSYLRWAGEEPAPNCPITFYDRHVDSNLILKNVKRLPLLPGYLSEVANKAVANILSIDFAFNPGAYAYPQRVPPPNFSSGCHVYDHYREFVGLISLRYASKLYLTPKDPTWQPCFVLDFDSRDGDFSASATSCLCYDPSRLKEKDPRYGMIDPDKRDMLSRLAETYPEISTWEFFPLTTSAKNLINRMRPVGPFQSETPGTIGYPSLNSSDPPPDAKSDLTSMLAQLEAERRQSMPRKAKAENLSPVPPLPLDLGDVVVPRRKKATKDYKPIPNHFLQHAWCRAADIDATFITFHCGKSERIGIRHRSSQTLYLSDPIDPAHCKNPAYGKLHLGLHLLAVKDAFERQIIREDNSSISHFSTKRPLDDSSGDPQRPHKKQKHDSGGGKANPVEESELVSNHMASRSLAIVVVHYGIYRSHIPSSFLRVGPSCATKPTKKTFKPARKLAKYPPTKYFVVTLTERALGSGAIGVVHAATVELELASGKKHQKKLVVKLAFLPEQQDKLRQEFSIYLRLASAKSRVEGILPVYGLFQDVETGALALLMDDGGFALSERDYQIFDENPRSKVTKTEFETLRGALKSIHRAGVLHRDIRLENMVADDQGRVFIIDFDCAIVDEQPSSHAAELRTLEYILRTPAE